MSIFSAELEETLASALHFIIVSRFDKFVIFSDLFTSYYKWIGTSHCSENFKFYAVIYLSPKTTFFCWLPSHFGNQGNKIADKTTKAALHKEITDIPIPYIDAYQYIKNHAFGLWQNEWSQQVNNKLHSTKPIIRFQPLDTSYLADIIMDNQSLLMT